jgi:hypothetical protein
MYYLGQVLEKQALEVALVCKKVHLGGDSLGRNLRMAWMPPVSPVLF